MLSSSIDVDASAYTKSQVRSVDGERTALVRPKRKLAIALYYICIHVSCQSKITTSTSEAQIHSAHPIVIRHAVLLKIESQVWIILSKQPTEQIDRPR